MLNERREWFRHAWPHALIIFGSEAAHDVVRDEAVDLWSIRSGTYRFGHVSGALEPDAAPRLEPIEASLPREPTPPGEHDLAHADRLLESDNPADRELGLEALLRSADEARRVGDHRTARSIASRALRYSTERPHQAFSAYTTLGLAYLQEGMPDEAEQALRRALDIAEELSDRPNLAVAYNTLSQIEKARGRLDEAERWLRKAIDIAEELGDRVKLKPFCANMAALMDAAGRADEARIWRERAKDLER